MMKRNFNNYTIEEFISYKNSHKKMFTAGPASLSKENLIGLDSCFGRSDKEYIKIEERVLNKLKKMAIKDKISFLQGSGSLALEIAINNFIYGKVLLINTGYYSKRLEQMINFIKRNNSIVQTLKIVNWNDLNKINEPFDWVLACSVETSVGLKLNIKELNKLCKVCKSKLFLDATASFGLEKDHELADIICFSSCKGLFGLTGASFVAFNDNPQNEVNSFYLNIYTHLERKVTGPYHSILSLDNVLKNHDNLKKSVIINKEKFLKLSKDYLIYPNSNQPLLCTAVNGSIMNYDEKSISYKPRDSQGLDIICHLGEVHLGKKANGNIIEGLYISET